jgi:uncharacterized protein
MGPTKESPPAAQGSADRSEQAIARTIERAGMRLAAEQLWVLFDDFGREVPEDPRTDPTADAPPGKPEQPEDPAPFAPQPRQPSSSPADARRAMAPPARSACSPGTDTVPARRSAERLRSLPSARGEVETTRRRGAAAHPLAEGPADPEGWPRRWASGKADATTWWSTVARMGDTVLRFAQHECMRPAAQSPGTITPPRFVILGYIAAIAGAEFLVASRLVVPGLLCHALVIQALLGHYLLLGRTTNEALEASPCNAAALPTLALVPLLRILSMTMPVREVPQVYWYAMIGVPLLLAAVLTARHLDLSRANLGLRLGSWPAQLPVALSGLPLGIAGFLLVRPQPLITRLDWGELIIGAASLAIFTGLTEELIFRGMVQRVTNEVFGRAGLLWSSALFVVMYLGSATPAYVVFMGLVGVFFGWCVNRTRSLWGVVVAHSLLNIGMMIAYPVIIAKLV